MGDGPEQQARLVHEMHAQVEEHPSPVVGRHLFSPRAGSGLGTPALETRLVADHVTEGPVGDEAAQREVLGVPTAVVEHGEHDAGLGGPLDQATGLRRVGSQRFLDHDGQAGIDGGGRQRCVGSRGRRHHDELVLVGPGPHLLRVRHHPGPGEIALGTGPAAGVGGDDRGDLESRGRGQQRAVEHRARQPVADQPDPERRHRPSRVGLRGVRPSPWSSPAVTRRRW